MIGSVPVGVVCLLLLVLEFGLLLVITRKGRRAGSALTPMEIFWAVFGALWAFSLSAGLLWSIVGVIAEAFTPVGPAPTP